MAGTGENWNMNSRPIGFMPFVRIRCRHGYKLALDLDGNIILLAFWPEKLDDQFHGQKCHGIVTGRKFESFWIKDDLRLFSCLT